MQIMFKNSMIFPELKGAIFGFALIFVLEWLLWPHRILGLRFVPQNILFSTLIMGTKALFLGAPLGWNSWSAWREWNLQRFAECKVRLRLVGWTLLLVQTVTIGIQVSLLDLWSLMRSDLPHTFLLFALNASLIWTLLLIFISLFLPKTERQKVQISDKLRF